MLPILTPSLRGRFLPHGGSPRINWDDPITRGLIGCWVPSNDRGKAVRNLVGIGCDLTFASGAARTYTREGEGLNSIVASGGADGLLPAGMKPTVASIFWRGTYTGAAGSNVLAMGVIYDGTAENSPYIPIGFLPAGTDLGFSTDAGGSFANNSATGAAKVDFNSWGGTADGINARIYAAGKKVATNAASGSLVYSATSRMCLGYYQPVTSRVSFTNSLIGCFWNRVLTDAEMAELHADPYRFLVYAEDELWAEMLRGVVAAGGASDPFWLPRRRALQTLTRR